MKLGLSLSAAALAISCLIAPPLAQAQDAAQKIFFEGDMVAGDASSGPVCVLNSQYKHGQTVVWRVRILDQTGKPLDAKDVKSLEVELPGGQMFAMRYGPHPKGKTDDYFWSASWKIPENHPTGTFSYKVLATDLHGQTHSWSPFNIDLSQLTIVK